MAVHQCAKFACSSFFERFFDAHSQVLGKVQILQHGVIILLSTLVLVFQDVSRLARKTRKKEQEVVFQFKKRIHLDRQRVGVNGIIGMKFKTGDAAICRNVLVLLADRFMQAVDLDFTCLFGQLSRRDQPAPVRVERFQERCGETAGGAQPGSGGNIRQRGDLDLRRL